MFAFSKTYEQHSNDTIFSWWFQNIQSLRKHNVCIKLPLSIEIYVTLKSSWYRPIRTWNTLQSNSIHLLTLRRESFHRVVADILCSIQCTLNRSAAHMTTSHRCVISITIAIANHRWNSGSSSNRFYGFIPSALQCAQVYRHGSDLPRKSQSINKSGGENANESGARPLRNHCWNIAGGKCRKNNCRGEVEWRGNYLILITKPEGRLMIGKICDGVSCHNVELISPVMLEKFDEQNKSTRRKSLFYLYATHTWYKYLEWWRDESFTES